MGKTRCKTKDYKPLGDELYICKNCKRRANKKNELCKGKKVHDFLEKAKGAEESKGLKKQKKSKKKAKKK